jgi:WD40 repeat protein
VYKILKHPDNNDKFASCSVDCTVKLWNMANNKKDSKKKAGGGETTLTGHFGYVVDITWLDMGTRLASASYDGSVKIWDTKKAECLFTLQEGLGNVNCISCTKSGLYLASAGHDGSVYFWSLKNGGKLLHTFDGPGRIMQASFNSSDSKLVVTSYGTVIILDLSFQALPRDRSSTSSINHHDDRKNNNKQNKQKMKGHP